MSMTTRMLRALVGILITTVGAADSSVADTLAAEWIWTSAAETAGEQAWFRRSFELGAVPDQAEISLTADNAFDLYVNGRMIGRRLLSDDWHQVARYEIAHALQPGRNVIAVRAINADGPAGLIASGTLTADSQKLDLSTGPHWKVSTRATRRWVQIDGDDSQWQAPHVLGEAGIAPWGAVGFPGVLQPALATTAPHPRREPFELRHEDRVVLLGDTFFERAQRYGWLETELQLRYPDRRIDFRNLGWSGDTVFAESRGIFDAPDKGYARMIEQVRELKPTVIVLHYGSNESFQGVDAIDHFLAGYDRLLTDLQSTNAEIVLVSPVPLFRVPAPFPDPTAHNRIRQQYVESVQHFAEQRGLFFVDLWSGLSKWNDTAPAAKFTLDGVHLTDVGYQHAARLFAGQLCGPAATDAEVAIDRAAGTGKGTACQLQNLNITDDATSFDIKLDGVGHARSLGLKINSLTPGDYEIRVDGKIQFSRITHVRLTGDLVRKAGGLRSSMAIGELRDRIVHKNMMYFHRWRPQNVTYLFLFRKHEQGQNAKEVDEFDALVAELDGQVYNFKQTPAVVHVDVVRVSPAGS